MNAILRALNANRQVSDYKINVHKKHSYELFFVKGRLETMRRTDTCDKEVTVYVDHDNSRGDARFYVYPSTTPEQLTQAVDQAVEQALLIHNQPYALPEAGAGSFEVESNFASFSPEDLGAQVAQAVFEANTIPGASLNSVEIFLTRHEQTVVNSRGLHKTQTRYDAMVEAIPTYNGPRQSVELYQQCNFSSFDAGSLGREIADKLLAAKARYEAVKPETPLDCPVVLNRQELSELAGSIARDLSYSMVYGHANLHKKGDAIQSAPTGDKLGITATGQIPGSVRSACFDGDGMNLGSIRLVEDGKAVNYFGDSRYGQYLGETPTGQLPCLRLDPGAEPLPEGPCLEVISMSGLQVEFFNDYIGGEVRLAYYHDGEKVQPVTGISIAGKLSQVLNAIRLSPDTCVYEGYSGPSKALLSNMNIF